MNSFKKTKRGKSPQQKKSSRDSKKNTQKQRAKVSGSRKKGAVLSASEVKPPSRGERRRHLDDRLTMLHQRAMLIEQELRELEQNRFYRTCIFGSARIKSDTSAYNDVYTLARCLAWEGIDVLTGGGPGLMEAANKGARLGRQEKKSRSVSYGLSIQLEWEPEPNSHLDVKRHHLRFSTRLDDFMRLSHSIICTPGGIGTLLELFFSWQLVQVKHIGRRPIVLLDSSYWTGIIEWMRQQTLARKLINPEDFDVISIVNSPEEAAMIISQHHQEFRKSVSDMKLAEAQKKAAK